MNQKCATRRHFERGDSADRAARRILDSDDYQRESFAQWEGQERIMINVHAIYRGLQGRRAAGTIERLNVLRKTALLAKELQ